MIHSLLSAAIARQSGNEGHKSKSALVGKLFSLQSGEAKNIR